MLKVKYILAIAFILKFGCLLAQDKREWEYPDGVKFERSKSDTLYFSGVVSVWRIKKNDTAYEFYPSGNLKSISQIGLSDSYKYIDTDRVEYTSSIFDLSGFCCIYFDDSSKKIAAAGLYAKINQWAYGSILISREG